MWTRKKSVKKSIQWGEYIIGQTFTIKVYMHGTRIAKQQGKHRYREIKKHGENTEKNQEEDIFTF